jgi:DNA-directed RNA polymerase subunit RPC12/RpoP
MDSDPQHPPNGPGKSMIMVACSHCGTATSYREASAGSYQPCPQCNAKVAIPLQASQEPDAQLLPSCRSPTKIPAKASAPPATDIPRPKIAVQCSQCGSKAMFSADSAGTYQTCPGCKAQIPVPVPSRTDAIEGTRAEFKRKLLIALGLILLIMLITGLVIPILGIQSWEDRITTFIFASVLVIGFGFITWLMLGSQSASKRKAPDLLIDRYRAVANPIGKQARYVASALGPHQAYTKLPGGQNLVEWIRNDAFDATRVSLILENDVCTELRHISHQEPLVPPPAPRTFWFFFWWRSGTD